MAADRETRSTIARMPSPANTPIGGEYRLRLARRREDLDRRERQHLLLSRIRLAILLAGIAMALAWRFAGGWWYAVPAIAFAIAVVVHARILDARTRATRAVSFYERGLARLAHTWMGAGDTGERYRQPEHPYAEDLDLFGRGSAFELLDTTRTQAGQDTLARWLLEAAPPDEVRARQEAVRELRPKLDLREELALQGESIGGNVNAARLRRWATAPPILENAALRAILASLASAIVVAGLLVAMQGAYVIPAGRALVILLALEGLLALWLRPRVKAVMHAVDLPAAELALLSRVLRVVESDSGSCPRLARIAQEIGGTTRPASVEIARLDRLVGLLQSRTNLLFAPLAGLLAWATQMTFAIEAWRRDVGPHVPRWLDALGEFEALAAFAGYASEHPRDVFPIFAESSGPPYSITASALAHPLLPDDAVANDLALGGDAPHLLVVSGSNMSGKSTLLRAVGLNVVLAQAGAPVRAVSFTLSPIAVGASIRIQDSLVDGRSRFFAEILRLKQVVELVRARQGGVLFLLDEILGGTNSHDRRAGSEAVLRGLTAFGAIGMITTHDLSLGEIGERLAPLAANVHFADAFDAGGLSFDYRLRPGVVRTSNALALMRSIGLDVDATDEG